MESKREKLLKIVTDYKVKFTFRKVWVITSLFCSVKDMSITFEPRTKEINLKKAQKAIRRIPKKYYSFVISSFVFFKNNTEANVCRANNDIRENIKKQQNLSDKPKNIK